MMKKTVFVYLLPFLLIAASLGSCRKPAREETAQKPETTVFTVDLDSVISLGTPISFAPDNTLYSELQWLAVQTACIGIYNNAQAGNYTLGDPQDHYKPADIRDFLTERSGAQTKTDMFYGICFNYAQAAYDDITQYTSHYTGLGLREWYIAGVFDDPGVIVLYDPVSRAKADMILNGVYVKEHSRRQVRSHGNATWHAWLWVIGNDGTIYWIDPTWTDNSGYVVWGVAREGEEVQLNPLQSLCVADINPADPSFAWNNRGNANKNNGDYDRAIADYTEALRLNPNDAVAYNYRGYAYDDKGDYDQAIADYNRAISLDSNYATAYNNRGLAYFKKGDYDRAIADLNQAIGLDPNVAGAYYNRGVAYTVKGDYDRAIADLTQAISLDPNVAFAYYIRGNAYRQKGDIEKAIADFNQAISLDPDDAGAYYNRGWAYDKKGDYDRAIADYTQAIRLEPSAVRYNSRGDAYRQKGDYDRAIADLNQAISLDPDYASAYYNRGNAYYTKGDYDRAIADYTQTIHLDPNFVHAYNNRGLAYYDKRDYDRAITDWEAVLRINANYPYARENLEYARQLRGY